MSNPFTNPYYEGRYFSYNEEDDLLIRELQAENTKLKRELESAKPIVKVGCMEESSGKKTYYVSLSHKKDFTPFDDFSLYSTEIEGRADYYADELRYFLGQRDKPCITDYNCDSN